MNALLHFSLRAAPILLAASAHAGVDPPWFEIATPVDDAIYGMDFCDPNLGFAVGWGLSEGAVILGTADAGRTWDVSIPVPVSILFSIARIDGLTGIAVGQAGWDTGLILRTTDGGQTWESTLLDTTFGLYDVQFIDELIGYTCGYDGGMYKTTDAGETWTKLDTGAPNQVFRDISFVNEQTGYALGGDPFAGRRVWRTEDAGASWQSVKNFGSAATLSALHFHDAQSGVVAGHYQGATSILRTTDGGDTWDKVVDDVSNNVLQAMHFRGRVGWAVGTGAKLYRTRNGGATWSYLGKPFSGPLLSVNVLSAGAMIGCGDSSLYHYDYAAVLTPGD